MYRSNIRAFNQWLKQLRKFNNQLFRHSISLPDFIKKYHKIHQDIHDTFIHSGLKKTSIWYHIFSYSDEKLTEIIKPIMNRHLINGENYGPLDDINRELKVAYFEYHLDAFITHVKIRILDFFKPLLN